MHFTKHVWMNTNKTSLLTQLNLFFSFKDIFKEGTLDFGRILALIM